MNRVGSVTLNRSQDCIRSGPTTVGIVNRWHSRLSLVPDRLPPLLPLPIPNPIVLSPCPSPPGFSPQNSRVGASRHEARNGEREIREGVGVVSDSRISDERSAVEHNSRAKDLIQNLSAKQHDSGWVHS